MVSQSLNIYYSPRVCGHVVVKVLPNPASPKNALDFAVLTREVFIERFADIPDLNLHLEAEEARAVSFSGAAALASQVSKLAG